MNTMSYVWNRDNDTMKQYQPPPPPPPDDVLSALSIFLQSNKK